MGRGMAANLPSGTVTFLFTDIEGSTKLAQQLRGSWEALRDRHAGIDYQAVLAAAGRRWPFVEFAKQLAAYLGRKGGLTAFTADELESLQKVYQRLTSLDAPMLREACERATRHTIADIVFVLQQLAHERQRRS